MRHPDEDPAPAARPGAGRRPRPARSAVGIAAVIVLAAGCAGFRNAVARVTGRPPAVSAPPDWKEYAVRRGDTLSAIARRHGSSVEGLARANGLPDPDQITVGQVLHVPPREGPESGGGPGKLGAAGASRPEIVRASATGSAPDPGLEAGPAEPPPAARLAEARARTAHAESRFWAADYEGALEECGRVGELLATGDSREARATRARAHLVAGMALAALERQDAAVARFREALEEDPSIALPTPPPPRIERLFELARGGSEASP